MNLSFLDNLNWIQLLPLGIGFLSNLVFYVDWSKEPKSRFEPPAVVFKIAWIVFYLLLGKSMDTLTTNLDQWLFGTILLLCFSWMPVYKFVKNKFFALFVLLLNWVASITYVVLAYEVRWYLFFFILWLTYDLLIGWDALRKKS